MVTEFLHKCPQWGLGVSVNKQYVWKIVFRKTRILFSLIALMKDKPGRSKWQSSCLKGRTLFLGPLPQRISDSSRKRKKIILPKVFQVIFLDSWGYHTLLVSSSNLTGCSFSVSFAGPSSSPRRLISGLSLGFFLGLPLFSF